MLLTCPLDRLTAPGREGLRAAAEQRNEALRRIVREGRISAAAATGAAAVGTAGTAAAAAAAGDAAAAAGGGAAGEGAAGGEAPAPAPPLLLDLDALTRQLPEGLAIGRGDFHYQCHLQSTTKLQSERGVQGGRRGW